MKKSGTYFSGKIFKTILFSIIFIIGSNLASAQLTSNYSFTQAAGSPTYLSAGYTTHGTGAIDDVVYNAVPIGFTFGFNCSNYTTVGICSNGFIVLGGTATSTYTPISGTTPNNVISAMGDDLQGLATATLRSQTLGSAPNRTFTVEWQHFQTYLGADDYSFQIVLTETTNTIKIYYASATTVAGNLFEVGIKGASNADFNNRTKAQATAWLSSTAGVLNTDVMATGGNVARNPQGIFTWTPSTSCSGTPVPGNTVSSANPACASEAFTLSLSNVLGCGITYQWQSAPAAGGPWTNIAGGTSATCSLTQSVATYYRCVVTCTTSGLSANSTTLYVTMSPPANCYCANTNTTNTSYYISNFTATGTTTINNTTGFSANGYGNYTAMSVTQMQSQIVTFSITEGGGTMQFGIWIDWNDDGDFVDAGENVYLNTTYNATVSGSFTVPTSAIVGCHRMRVVGSYIGAPPVCVGSTYTECEDYNICITALPLCSGAPVGGTTTASTLAGCTGYTGAISVTGSTVASGVTYQWYSSPTGGAPWTLIPGATGETYTPTVSGLYYRRVITCTSSGLTANSSSLLYNSSSPVNDECVNAIALTVNPTTTCTVVTPGTIACASASPDANSCSVTADDDVWFSFVATSNIEIVSILNAAGSTTDMYHAIYSGTCGSLTSIMCNDADVSNLSGLIIGQTYYIRVWTYTTTTGQTTTFNICVASVPPPPVQPPCTNLGFESGWTGWYCTAGGSDDGAVGAPCPTYVPVLLNNSTTTQTTLMTAGTDPYGGFPTVFNGTYSARVGNSSTSETYSAGSIEQTFLVDATNTDFSYSYAVVLQDGGSGHDAWVQPYFTIGVYDQTGAEITCGMYIMTAPGVGYTLAPGYTDVYYKPWSTVSVNLSSYIGQNVTIRIVGSDCAWEAHFGYAYIDCSCSPFGIINPAVICAGQNATLTAPPGAASYSWTPGGATTQSITVSPAATTTYTCNMTTSGITPCPVMLTGTVTVFSAGSVTATASPASVCAGQNTTLTATGGNTYVWMPGSLSGSSVTVSPAATTTYTVTATAAGGCTASTTVTVTVSSTATITASASPAAICNGASSVLTASGGNTYLWNGGSTSNPLTVSPASTTTYSVTGTTSTGCTGTTTVTVTVNSVPVITAPANISVCAGTAIPIGSIVSVPAGATYTWTNSNTAIGLAANGVGQRPAFTATNATGAAITGTITITPTIGTCVGLPVSYTITVNPLPVITAPANISVCAGTAIPIGSVVSVPAGATYTWTNSNTAIGLAASGTGQRPAFTATNATGAAITGTITITPTIGTCVGLPVSYTITVNPLPVITAPANISVCAGTAIPIGSVVSVPAGATFAWTNSNTAIGLAASGTGQVPAFTATNATGAAITGTITITPTIGTCVGLPVSYTITVNPLPVITAPANISVCAGTAIPIGSVVSVPAGATYTWTNSNTAIGLAANGVGQRPAFTATNATGAAITGTITITPTIGTCVGLPVSYTITVNPLPVITAPANISVCAGTAIPIGSVVSVPAGATYTWTNSNTAIGLAANGVGQRPAFTATNATGAAITGTISITPTIGTCVGLPVSYTITVNPLPVITAPANISVCAGTAIPIGTIVSVPAGATYAWTNSNTAIGLAASGTGQVPAFTATNATGAAITGTITITPTIGTCVGLPVSYTITVNPLPVITAPANITVCAGTAIPIGTIVSVPAGATFAWTNSNTAIGLAANGVGQRPAFTATNATGAAITGTITITPTIGTCVGLPVSYTITVNPLPVITAPANITVCAGTAIPIGTIVSVPAGATFAWTNSNTAIGLAANGVGQRPAFTATNATGAAITGTITITPTIGTCVGLPVSYTITVNPLPVITAPANITVCAGTAIPIGTIVSVPAGATYAWTNSNTAIGLAASGTGQVPAFTATNATGAAITGTITITPTIGTCVGLPVSYTITVNPLPVITAPANITVCAGTAIPIGSVVSVPAGATYTWTNSNTAIGLAANGVGQRPAFTATNATGAAITGTITITPTIGTCVGLPVSYTITVNPLPVITAPANISVCAGTAIPIGSVVSVPAGATFAWTNSNAAIGLAASGTGQRPAFTATNATGAAITGTITITPTIGTCVGLPVSYTITVNPLPVITAPANITVCAGTAIPIGSVVSVPAGATFAWTNSNTAIGLAANGVGQRPAFTATNATGAAITGTITITPTIGTCVGLPVFYTITVNPLPVITAPANISVCAGTAIPIGTIVSVPAGATYAWTNSNTAIGLAASGTGQVPAFTATNATGAAITGTITITPTIGTCVGLPVSYTITVNPLPVITAPANITVCAGTAIPIGSVVSVPAGATYAWTNSNTAIGLAASGTGQVPAFTATNATGAAITGTITITPTIGTCVGLPVSYTITVNPIDNPAFNYSPTTFCQTGTDPAANITGGATGNFSASPAGLVFLNTATGLIDLSASAINTYTITFTTSGVCPSTSSTTITITLSPIATFNYAGPYCPGGIDPLPTFSVGASAGIFSAIPAGLVFISTATGQVDLSASTPGTYTVTNSIAASGGCVAVSATNTITINPTPTVAVPANIVVCNNGAVAATNFISTPAGGTFTWTNSNTAIGLGASGVGNIAGFTATNATTAPITATITVTPTANGCLGTPSSYTITVNPTPTVTVPANIVVCNNGAVAATNFVSTPAGGTFTWTNSNTAIGLGASGVGNIAGFTATNATTAPITATITVTPTVNGCAGTSSSYTITVNPTPTVTVPANIVVCNNGAVAATNFVSTPAGGTFAWTNSNTAIGLGASGVGNIAGFTATNATTAPITATITVTPTANGCLGTPSSYTITVNPTPTVTVPANIVVCNNGAVATTNFVSTPAGGTFTWTNSNTAIGLGASGVGNIAGFTATNATTAPITATITVTPTANGCLGTPSSYTITVNPTPTVTVPANIVVCNNGAVAATNFVSTPAGGTFTWTNSNTAIGLGASGFGNIAGFTATNATTAPIAATITVTPTVNGCAGTSSSYTITVNPTPTVTVPANIVVCNNGAVAATNFVSTPAGGTFTWTNSNTAIGLGASGVGNIAGFTATNATTAPITATITVTPTANGCLGTPSSYTITVNPTPTVTVPANIVVCNNGAVAATNFVSTPAGGTFTWTNSNTAIGLAASGVGNIAGFTATNATTAPITATITVTPTANGCLGTSSSYTITVNPTPTVSVPANITVCNNGAVAAANFVSTPAGGTFTWTNSNTAIGLAANGVGNIPGFTAINLTAAAITATITVTPTANGCTGTPSSYTITVNPTDNPAFNYTPSTMCQTGTDPAANITGGATGTFSSSPAGLVFLNTTTGIIDVSASAVNTYTITFTTNGVCPSTSTTTVSIILAPIATFNYAGPYCPGGIDPSPTFAAGASAGTFSAVPAGLVFISTATGQVDLSASTPGTYTVTNSIAAANGCAAATATSTITINPTPTVTVPANITVCNNGTVAGTNFVSIPAGGTFTWTNSNTAIGLGGSGVGNIAGFTATNATTTPITATITVTPTVNGCLGTPSSYTITVNPTPTVSVPTNIVVCNNGTVSATNFVSNPSGGTFAWTNSNTAIGLGASGVGNIAGFTATNATTAPITATITVTPTFNGCAGTASSYTITVNPTPTVSVPANVSLCTGASVPAATFTSTTPGATFTWTNSNASIGLAASGTGNIAAFTANNTGNSPVIATITVTPSANGCTGTPSTYTITVNPLPQISFPALPAICADAPATTLSGATPVGGVYSGTGVTGGSFNPAVSGTGTFVLTYTYTDANGCTNSATQNITVNAVPVITVIPQNSNICAGTSVTLTASGASTYTWSPATGLSATTGNSVLASPLTTTTYVVTGTLSGCSNTADVTVNVYTSIPITVTPSAVSICPGQSTVLVASGAVNYTWSPATGLSATTGASVTATPTTTTIYNVIGSDAGGCTGSANAVVTINPLASINFLSMPESGCAPLSVDFLFIPNPFIQNSSWQWNFGDNNSGTNNTSSDTAATHIYQYNGYYIVNLNALTVDGCAVNATDTIQVFEVPIADFTAHPEVITTENPLVDFIDNSIGSYTWNWNFGDPASELLNESTLQNPTHQFFTSGEYQVVMVVSNEHGCTDTASKMVIVHDAFAFFIPNAFSPNEDLVNDMFLPKGSGFKTETFKMRIYDRWGKQICYTEDIEKGWDGKDEKSGKLQAQGIYSYLICVFDDSNLEHRFTGTITLLQ